MHKPISRSAMVLPLLVFGCVNRQPVSVSPATPLEPASIEEPIFESVLLGHSVRHRPIRADVFGYGDDCVLIMATIHGDEAAGTPLLRRLSRYLTAEPLLAKGRKIVLMPVANPDGYEARSRRNVNGVDLNRNFPAKNRKNSARYGRKALSEPEAKAIAYAIERFEPDRIVSIHQPVDCIDYDGPASELAQQMAKAGRLKVKRLGAKPGSLGSWTGVTLGIPTVTVELPGKASRKSSQELWDRYKPMLLAAIRYDAS